MSEGQEAKPLYFNKRRIKVFLPIRLSLCIGYLYVIEQVISIALSYPSAMRGGHLVLAVVMGCLAPLVFLVLFPRTVFFIYALFSKKPFLILDKNGILFPLFPRLLSFSRDLFICWEDLGEIYLVADSPEPLLGMILHPSVLSREQKTVKQIQLHCSWLAISLEELLSLIESLSGKRVHGQSFLAGADRAESQRDA